MPFVKKNQPAAQPQEEITFALFFLLWAKMQGWTPPPFHWEIINFLETYETWGNDTGVLQVFRGAGKSTIIALYIVFRLLKDPTLRFLILSADNDTAMKITEDCLAIIRRHPLAQNLHGREQTWQKHKFFVRGSTDARNPSVEAAGILSNVTSSRADFLIFDDVEVPKNTHNDERRESLRRRISETTHLLIPQTGRRLYIGTPHVEESIYPEMIGKGASSLTLPLITNAEGEFPNITGKSRWPERFDDATMKSRQLAAKSKGEFLSQYQLMPYKVTDSIFDPADLKVYDHEITFREYGDNKWVAHIGDKKVVSVTAYWDVALSKVKRDDSVIAIVFIADNGDIFIHRTVCVTGDVDEQCIQVVDLVKSFHIPIVTVETNGVGGFVPRVLMKYAKPKGVAVAEHYTTKNKGQKIIEAIETPLSGHFMFIHKSVFDTKFVSQLRDFHPKYNTSHDDFIDATASAISLEPIRLVSGYIKSGGNRSWRGSGEGVEAQQDQLNL